MYMQMYVFTSVMNAMILAPYVLLVCLSVNKTTQKVIFGTQFGRNGNDPRIRTVVMAFGKVLPQNKFNLT